MKTENAADTPLMKQYQSVKTAYPHAIVFFRLGDFYEMFGDDAKTASGVLGLVLTARHGVPMCGIPHHASSAHIAKLLKAGHKIAICEQLEDVSAANKSKGLFKREVIRLITPGTVIEDELLDARTANHLVCVEADIVGWGLACVEVSTGDFWATQKMSDSSLRLLAETLARINPSEILISPETKARLDGKRLLPESAALTVNARPYGNLEVPETWPRRELWGNRQLALKAALRAAAYVGENEPKLKSALAPHYREPATHLRLDENAVRTLELVSSPYGGRAQSLWGALDYTKTPMGSRLLREWLLQPLIELPDIRKRQDCVAEFVSNSQSRQAVSGALECVSDIERVLARVAAFSASPRDVSALHKSLGAVAPLKEQLALLSDRMPWLYAELETLLPALAEVSELLSKSLSDSPPARISDGGAIRDGFHAELDELRALRKNGKGSLQALEQREREATQIPTLKVGYNSVFGYYIEATKANLHKIPPGYIRKQTLANAERFITEELKDLEAKLLGAEDRILRLEAHLFDEIRKELLCRAAELKAFAKCAAALDVYLSLAQAAIKGGYVRPEVDLSQELVFEGARHPVVERNLPSGAFMPNDLNLDSGNTRIMIITGPNMSGKSVYLRQNALLVIMAQMGSFVPAQSARVGIIDRIMTRIGAHDAMSRGESTFMVEMRETAGILSSLTPRSLVLLDEIGRGTSTFDGISIAWAVVEFLCKQDGPKVLFATHYFELTELEEKHKNIGNFNIEVKEWTNALGKTELVFLHKIAPGPADKSYGIHVAEIAGLPDSCIAKARDILRNLEKKTAPSAADPEQPPLLPLFGGNPVLDEIKSCDPDRLTPLEALQAITEWKKRMQ